MRIICPLCGDWDRREFYYQGDGVMLERPAADAGADVCDSYLYLRDNLAGRTRDLWHHGAGCGAWFFVTRDTVTHEVCATALARDLARDVAGTGS